MKEMKLDRKTRYTRMVLQDSLIELMKEKSINKITIKELCEKADINRTTFYTHYTDQYDLLRKIEDETLSWAKEAVAAAVSKTDRHETMRILEEICQYFVENSRHLQVLMSEQGDIDFQKQLFTLIYELCGINSSTDHNADANTRECYFIFVVNGSVGLIRYWLKNGLNRSAKEMAEIIYNMAIPVRQVTALESHIMKL
jgi:AcrR family transcriptional regulator